MTNAPPTLPNFAPPRGSRIAVAMSGGVDSSVAAWLLARQGYDVMGFTAWTLDGPGKCCNDALVNAGRVCEMLGISYDAVDLRDTFKHFVQDHYHQSYLAGLTPNPCVECNRHVKWEPLIRYALEQWNVDYVATGHYARLNPITRHNQPDVQVFRPADSRKDQTYMMSRVYKPDLLRTVFPLGDMVKPEVLAMAREVDLPTAYSKESMDVCFVLDGQANYLKQVLGSTSGPVVDYDTGKVVGEHEGHYLFTVGQRKGVQVAVGRPVYVIRVDATSNTVYIGDAHHLETTTFMARSVHWLWQPEEYPATVQVKIRYNSPATLAQIEPVGNWRADGEQDVKVTFLAPVRAVTPGQIAVFYDEADEQLLGGGYIESHLNHQPFKGQAVQAMSACPA